jgi:hypothetical protein
METMDIVRRPVAVEAFAKSVFSIGAYLQTDYAMFL